MAASSSPCEGGRGRLRSCWGGECIISERARSSGHCPDCPRWLRSPWSGAARRCRRTPTAAESPSSRSPVLSREPPPPAGRPSPSSTSSSGSGTTPSPAGVKQRHVGKVLLPLQPDRTPIWTRQLQAGLMSVRLLKPISSGSRDPLMGGYFWRVASDSQDVRCL